MTGPKTPCQLDPEAFDVDPGTRRRDANPPDVQALIQACRTACPILDLCAANAADPDTAEMYGVVAGEYRPWPGDTVVLTINQKTAKGRVIAGLTEIVETLNPGDPVPSAVDLARLYGVARTTALSALRCLAGEGILTRPGGYGHRYQRTEIAA